MKRIFLLRFGRDKLSRAYWVTELEGQFALVWVPEKAFGWPTRQEAENYRLKLIAAQNPVMALKLTQELEIEEHDFGSKSQ